MRFVLTLVLALALAATSAHAQIGPPERVRTFGFPILIQTGSAEIGGTVVGEGTSSPIIGFTAIDIGSAGDWTRSIVIDVTGGAAVVACFALSCTGLGEDNWVFVDGVLLPRFDATLMRNVGVGSVGGGVHFSAAAAGSDDDSFGWVELGPMLSYAAQVGPATVLAGATYAYGFEGGSQAVTGRAASVRTDVIVPLGRLKLIGYVLADRHTDTNGTDIETDDLRISTLTFGAGLGF